MRYAPSQVPEELISHVTHHAQQPGDTSINALSQHIAGAYASLSEALAAKGLQVTQNVKHDIALVRLRQSVWQKS